MGGYFGQQDSLDGNSDFTAIRFLAKQILGYLRTGMPVKVVAVTGGGIGPAPTVDVLPLVKQIDGQGNPTDHGTVYGRPVVRHQGGLNAIIADPVVGDIGFLVSADRDMSKVVATRDAANPDSRRSHSMSDGVYYPAILGLTPTQYLHFTTTGIKIVDKNGNIAELTNSGEPWMYLYPKEQHQIWLGGDSTMAAKMDWVETASGPSVNVKARFTW